VEKSVDGAQKGSAARNVTETKFIWKNRKLKRPYKRSFLIQMALVKTSENLDTSTTLDKLFNYAIT
jgi:hypothetical protein